MSTPQLNTNTTWPESLADLKTEFRKWQVEDYILPLKADATRAGFVTVGFCRNNIWVYPRCGAYRTPEQNIRAIVLTIQRVRIADQQGIGGLLAEAARALALPSGKKSPYEVLGAPEGARGTEVLKKAWRRKLQEVHPDMPGGSREAYDAVQKAAEELGIL